MRPPTKRATRPRSHLFPLDQVLAWLASIAWKQGTSNSPRMLHRQLTLPNQMPKLLKRVHWAKTMNILRAIQFFGWAGAFKMLGIAPSTSLLACSWSSLRSCSLYIRESTVPESRSRWADHSRASWLWHHVSPALPIIFAYLFFICLSSFLHASLVDPGVRLRHIQVRIVF